MNGNETNIFPMSPVELLGIKTYPEKSACNVRIIFDKASTSAHLYLQSAVHAFTTSRIYVCIRRHLHIESANLLANAPVCSRLDYCTLRLSGIVETDLIKPQHVLNRPACVVTIYTKGSTAASKI